MKNPLSQGEQNTKVAPYSKKFYMHQIQHVLMHKITTCVLTAAILLTAIALVTIYTVNAVNAQGNATSAGGANMTKNNMTNTTSGALKNATAAAKAPAAKRESSPQQ